MVIIVIAYTYGKRVKLNNTKFSGTYGGFTWESLSDLSEQLGFERCYVSALMRRKRISIEDVIDNCSLYKSYRDVIYKDIKDVVSYFGYPIDHYNKWHKLHPTKTVKDYIDYCWSVRKV